MTRKGAPVGDTLQDLKNRDIDNLEFILKNKQIHHFKDGQAAFTASGEMMRLAVLRGGVDLHGIMEMSNDLDAVGEMTQEAMEQNGVRIETRNYKGVDEWRSGTYVYKNNEILAFIGGIKNGQFGGKTIETTEARGIY